MKGQSVRLTLGLLVVGSVLPVVAMATFVIWSYYQQQQIQISSDAISRVRAVSSAIDREFDSLEASLTALATSPLLARNDLAEFYAHTVLALANIDAESIELMDRSGQLLLSTNRPFGTPLPMVAKSELMQRVLETGKSAVSDLFFGAITLKPTYSLDVPVIREGSVIYTLNATATSSQLMGLLADQKLPASWRAVITDSSGSIVARTHGITKFLGEKVVPDLLQHMRLANEGAFESRVLEGIPVLLAYSRSMKTGWSIAIGSPLAELKAGIYQTLGQMLTVTLIALLIGLALAWHFGGRITNSFRELIAPAKALGAGGAMSVPRLQIREANEVAKVLLDATRLLKQASNVKADFLSSMSHELRTPLNAILGFAQLMDSGSPPPTPSQKKSLEHILKAGWHLLELVNGVLNLALIESGKLKKSDETVSLSEIMSQCQLMVEPHAKNRDVSLTFPQFETACYVYADRSWLNQCLVNLLINAVRYNKPGGTVVVEFTLRTPDMVRIIVRDTGAGLSAQQLAQLFQPFNRLSMELGTEKDMGLNLAVTKRLVELMGGTIGADSVVAEGSTFWIELNLTSAPKAVAPMLTQGQDGVALRPTALK